MSTTRTIAVTGASEHDVARINGLLDRHRHKLSSAWTSAEAADADLLLIDIESMYGQMDWLRARSRGRLVIAYTSAAQPLEPEFSLRKPVVSNDLVKLLNRISAGMANGKTELSQAMQPANSETYESAPAIESTIEAPAPKLEAVAAHREPVIEPAPAAPAEPDIYFVDELVRILDVSAGPVRLVCEGLPSIIIDPARQKWFAGVGLKALTGWSKHPVRREHLIHLDADEFANAVDILPAQPYSRLIWLAHLARWEGQLDPGLPADARYRLTRWPQVEREFPKHFRIATAMMSGIGTIDEIATQSKAAASDVVDFINAYNALGYVECEVALPVTSPNDRNGLLDRVRKSLRTSALQPSGR
jgi:hypothetical protein